jgi:hypothetical protein
VLNCLFLGRYCIYYYNCIVDRAHDLVAGPNVHTSDNAQCEPEYHFEEVEYHVGLEAAPPLERFEIVCEKLVSDEDYRIGGLYVSE